MQAFTVTFHKILTLFSMLNLKAGIILLINEQSRLGALNFSFSWMSYVSPAEALHFSLCTAWFFSLSILVQPLAGWVFTKGKGQAQLR